MLHYNLINVRKKLQMSKRIFKRIGLDWGVFYVPTNTV